MHWQYIRFNIRRRWWAFLSSRKFVRKIVSEELTDALHPEFGWAWREDETIGRVLKERNKELYYLRINIGIQRDQVEMLTTKVKSQQQTIRDLKAAFPYPPNVPIRRN